MVKKSLFYSLFLTFLSILVVPSKSTELFSAIFQMESLMETHKYVASQLSALIDEEQGFLDSIKSWNTNRTSENEINFVIPQRLVKRYEEEHIEAQNDINKYLGNPLNTFFLIKQLTVGLDDIQKMFEGSAKKMKNFTLDKKGLQYPNEDDLTGAATAIGRLQEFYKFNTTELAAGYINRQKISRELSVDDCMDLARRLYNSENYELAIPWMEEALRKYNERDDLNVHRINEMLDFIAFSYYQLGDLENARDWTLKILKSEPNDPRAGSNLKHYQRILHQRKQIQSVSNEDASKYKKHEKFIERYHGACRGDFEIPSNITKSFKCYYMTENHAFLKIAPFKVEELYYYPKAYIVHDVITDDEIGFIKNISIPKMTRAKVLLENGEGGPSEHRTSQFSWLHDADHPRLAVISQRTSDFTGLCTASAEPLQVSNYGIGGHYIFHHDYFWEEDDSPNLDTAWGDRISTVLYYLSDVEKGGGTAFPMLGLAVFPKKGSALVWNNLHPSGQGNELTIHAACPVLLGDKWVANKWIRSSGQELRWPCHLDPEYGLDTEPPPISRKQPI